MNRPPLSFLFPRDDGVPDAVLLRRYADGRDEAAFELLVRRHADAVWTVCRATAGDHHAAEDAFQAAFFTLAKKANGVRDHLAGWLHRVAYHAALKARPRHAPGVGEPAAPAADGLSPGDAAAIHADLAALPDRYRLPLVLCDLEGLTHAEAARQLGWPVGSVSGRLVRGRERLKEKLVRRGLAPTAVALAVLPLNAASPLIRTVVAGGPVPPAVAALSHGVLTAMRVAKLKLTAAVAAGVVGLAGVVTVLGVSTAQPPGGPPAAKADPPAARKKDVRPVADAKQRAYSVQQMKQILLAIHTYHDANGHLPADVLGKDGKPILSWRVLVLPYLEEAWLYQKFKLDEPWDSDHNKPLAETVVKPFSNGHEPTNTKYAMTFFQRPTGKGTMHDPRRTAGDPAGGGGDSGAGGAPAGASAAGLGGDAAPAGGKIRLVDVTDGTSNTICLVEAEKAVEWAKPDDLAFDLAKPADLRGPFANVFHGGLADGSVKTFAGGVGKDAAKWLIGRDDGQPFDLAGYRGLGGPATDDPQEAAALAKEIADTTAALAKLLDENQKLRLELLKLRADRLKKAGNVPLAGSLLDLEGLLAAEKNVRANLERELKTEKGERPAPPKPVKKE